MSRHPSSDGYSQASDWLIGTVKRNPEGFLLLAAGCALMMRSGRSSGSQESRSDGGHSREQWARQYDSSYRPGSNGGSSNVGERFSQTARDAADYASEVKDRVADTAGSVADTASSYASTVVDYASAAGHSVSDQSSRIASQARSSMGHATDRVLRDQPLVVALVGLAAGAAVAAAFPTTEIERRTLGDAGEKLADAAGKAGEQLKDAGAKAGERLLNAAEDRGLNSEGLKAVARDVAGAFGDAIAGNETKNASPSPTPSDQSGATSSRDPSSGSQAGSGQASMGTGGREKLGSSQAYSGGTGYGNKA